MNNLFAAAAAAMCFASCAYAECDTSIGTACDLQRIQNSMPNHVGAKAPTPVDMVCLSVLATKPGALALAKGRVRRGEPITGKIITSWRIQKKAWQQAQRGYVREICIPAWMINGVVTLCNDEHRSIWTVSDTSHLRKVKRIKKTDPACLLGEAGCSAIGL